MSALRPAALAVGQAPGTPVPKGKKETEVPGREEPDIVVRIVAMVVVVHVRAILIRIAEQDATTHRRLTIIAQVHLTSHHRSTICASPLRGQAKSHG